MHNTPQKTKFNKNLLQKFYKLNLTFEKMKKRLYRFFIGSKNFENEFRKQIRMLIIITLGFTIAFTWRQTIFDLSQSFVNFFIHVQSSSLSSIFASTFITIISILLIYITTYFLKEKK